MKKFIILSILFTLHSTLYSQTLTTSVTKVGEAWQVAVGLTTEATDYCDLQMDVDCAGAFLVSDVEAGAPLAAHTVRYGEFEGMTRVLAYSLDDTVFALDGTPLMTILLTPIEGQTAEAVRLTAIRVAHTSGAEDLVADVTVGLIESAIRGVNAAGSPSQAYDLSGRRIDVPAKGLYIIDGRKQVR